MVTAWRILFTTEAKKDLARLESSSLRLKANVLLDILSRNPFEMPPRYEKLAAEITGTYSRRINSQHRLVYQVFKNERVVKVIRMWTHYE